MRKVTGRVPWRVTAAVVLLGAMLAACGDDGPQRWLALGDSYSSGEGTMDARGLCGRGPGAYAPLAAGQVEDVELVFEACSGAVTPEVADQLTDATADGTRFDLVTLTSGGNDAGYANVLSDCLGVDDAIERFSDLVGDGGPSATEGDEGMKSVLRGCDVDEEDLSRRIEGVATRLAELLDDVDDHLTDDGRIVLVGYPHLFEPPATWPADEGRRCAGILDDDVEALRRAGSSLDATLREVAEGNDVTQYLSTLELFGDHGLCSTDPWLNGIVLRPRIFGSFHPNDAGHEAVADALVDLLEE